MQATLTGLVVGVEHETWPQRGDRPAGDRLTLFIQEDEQGKRAPSAVTVPVPLRNGVSALTFGVAVRIPVEVRAWASNGRGELVMTAVGPFELARKAEAVAAR